MEAPHVAVVSRVSPPFVARLAAQLDGFRRSAHGSVVLHGLSCEGELRVINSWVGGYNRGYNRGELVVD